MRVSVIISTYNSPEWLEKVLWGYAAQTTGDFEVVIADDGSTAETALVIERMRRKGRLHIAHVWHPDQGFRKCRILNRAIAESSGDYLIFSDGDCIPRADFVATHVRLARPGRALSGGCVRLQRALSEVITPPDIFSGRCMQAGWLWSRGLRSARGLVKLHSSGSAAGRLADGLTPTQASFNGHNASVWRGDALRVNGFDERLQYGGLDREFGERLIHAGVRFGRVRHQAICLHLDHPRPYMDAQGWRCNDAIRAETRREQRTWTPHGIRQAETPFVARPSRAA